MKRAVVGTIVAAVGLACVVGCSAATQGEVTDKAEEAATGSPQPSSSQNPPPPVFICTNPINYTGVKLNWLPDSNCGCTQWANNQGDTQQCYYERGVAACMRKFNPALVRCSNLPPKHHEEKNDGLWWVAEDSTNWNGFNYRDAPPVNGETFLDCINTLNASWGPYGAYTASPVFAKVRAYCSNGGTLKYVEWR